MFFFFKQKTAYEMRISDWSSDVCSSDLGVTLRNRTRWADQDKFYQNVYPGAVTADGTQVSISAYNNLTARKNLFNQTDLTFGLNTGAISHALLVGAELSRQETDNQIGRAHV